MAKQSALRDRIEIDGTTFSAGECSSVDPEDSKDEQDASGFSVSGRDEKVSGQRTQSVTFEFFHTQETFALLYPIYDGAEIVNIEWQPDGLVDTGRETLYGPAELVSLKVGAARGDIRKMTARFVPGSDAGFGYYAAS
jgi:hypothetical protein